MGEAGYLEALRARAARSGQPAGMIDGALVVPVGRFGALLKAVRELGIGAEAAGLRGMLFPGIGQTVTALLRWRSGLVGLAVVLGLGSMPNLATTLEHVRMRGCGRRRGAAG